MGRPAKNVNHPLVRLRRKLSDWSAHKVTRQDLAKKAGIPESSLRDIETGRYKLTPAVATKISFATGVDPQSLLDGDDPLLDLLRQPFSKESPRWSEYAEWSEEYRGAREQLFFALLDMAEEKKIARLIYFSFENWLNTTIEAFGLNDLFAQKLTDRFTLFDPYFVSDEFFPKNKRVAEKWSNLEYQLNQEYVHLLDQYQADNPTHPAFFSSEQIDSVLSPPSVPIGDLLKLEHQLKKKLRMQARENLAIKQQEDAAKSATAKPLSGKRPRSAGRPAA